MPASTSYDVMLAFLHAQATGRLKQVVVGLDFFGFNILFQHNREMLEGRVAGLGVYQFSDFLNAELAERAARKAFLPVEPAKPAGPQWDEKLYLALNPDVGAAIKRGEFKSGREHWELAGRAEGRQSGIIPETWSENRYLRMYPDVWIAVSNGFFMSGLHHYRANGRNEGRYGELPHGWNDELYLVINQDVLPAIKGGSFLDGYHHYLAAGRAEGRETGIPPPDWREQEYRQVNRDVELGIFIGIFYNGYHHWLAAGRHEGRSGGFWPKDWDEARYLAVNADARIRVALGEFSTGRAHYLAIGQRQGLLGGNRPANIGERLLLRWPRVNKALFQIDELYHFLLSVTALAEAVATVERQSEISQFDAAGMRYFTGQEDALIKLGGVGQMIRGDLAGGSWGPVLTQPHLMFCFTNNQSGMTMFDPFRFMLRRAYAEGTDLRMFITPIHSVSRYVLQTLGLGGRYDFWVREMVRINAEEAARAGRKPLPLWDFSYPNAITTEPIPPAGDLSPMHWYWEYSHYRKATGDLILDRMLEHSEPGRQAPEDFGVRLTAGNVDAHLIESRRDLDVWASANSDLTAPITRATRDLTKHSRQSAAACW